MEIERKYLVKSNQYKSESQEHHSITQGYLNSNPERTVRIRTRGEKAYLTIKGKSSDSGMSRFEWEKEISISEANELLKLCEPGIIKKTRYLVEFDGHTFEVDEFQDENGGLIIAEIELESEDSDFSIPAWLGEEVTGDKRYYNSFLSKNPYSTW